MVVHVYMLTQIMMWMNGGRWERRWRDPACAIQSMFKQATSFNQPLGSWNTAKATNFIVSACVYELLEEGHGFDICEGYGFDI